MDKRGFSRYQGTMPVSLIAGIKERFGDDVFERVEKEGGAPMPLKTSSGRTIEAVFDDTVSLSLSQMALNSRISNRVLSFLKLASMHSQFDHRNSYPWASGNFSAVLASPARLFCYVL